MAFHCPACSGATLGITYSLDLPPVGDDDEITLQTLKCAACEFRGVAVYRESRHGRLGSESWQHNGYPIDDALEDLYEALLLCPSPHDRRCGCATHVDLAQRNWANPAHPGVDATERFEMRLVR